MSELEQVWRQAPLPALRLWHGPQGRQIEVNAAARTWGALGQPAADWQALAEAALRGDPSWLLPPLPPVTLTVVPLADGLLVWWAPTPAPVPPPVPASVPAPEQSGVGLSQILNLLQGHARIGFGWRCLDGSQAHWDATMHEILGTDPGAGCHLCTKRWSWFTRRTVKPSVGVRCAAWPSPVPAACGFASVGPTTRCVT